MLWQRFSCCLFVFLDQAMQNRSTLVARTGHSLAPFIGFQPVSKNTTGNRLTVAGERERGGVEYRCALQQGYRERVDKTS